MGNSSSSNNNQNPENLYPNLDQPTIDHPMPRDHPYLNKQLENPSKYNHQNPYVSSGQNTETINILQERLKQQEIKIKEQQQSLQSMNMKNKSKENDPYEGAYNFGKNNIVKWQGMCSGCRMNKMIKNLDYSKTRTMCKCEGYGITQGKKTKNKCSEWLCRKNVYTLNICEKCYGFGYKTK